MDALTFLKDHVALFSGVAEERLAELAGRATLATYAAGHTILFKGATVDGLHIVCSGKVAVSAKIPNKGVVTLAELGPTEVFGETSIVEMGTAGAAVKSIADDTLVLVIPQDAFRGVLQQDEAFAVRVNTLIRSRKAPVAAPAQPA